ncbi:hypothetical protein V8C86DRAFT_3022064, partial [Haematococcus lacustris]
MAGQALGTVTNDPRAHEPKSWFGWGRSDLSRAGPPPALDPNKYPNIKRKDLEPYLRVIRGAHQHFLQDRESLAEANNRQALLDGFEPGSVPGQTVACHQGDGLAKALQRVPAQFFQEDFSVEASGLLHGAESPAELGERIDALSGYLDVVESELMREVAVRSSRVFQAAGDVSIVHQQLLPGGHAVSQPAAGAPLSSSPPQQLCGALGGVRGLRHHLHTVDASTYACACNVVALQSRRGALAAALDTLQGLEEVALSRSALQLLLDSQDYAAALDMLEVVVLNVEASTSMGLQAFSQALPQLRETRELLLSLLACEFVSLAHFSQASQVMDAAIAQAVAGATGAGTPGAQGLLMPGQAQGPQQQQQQQQAGGLLEARALTTTELQPCCLLVRGWGSSEEAAAEREVLHDKLLPIVLALLRVDKLSGALQQLRDNSSAATKAVMQEVLQRMLLGPLGLPHLQAQIQPPPLAAPPFHPPGPLPSIRRVQGGGAGTSHQRHASMGALGGMGGGGGPPLPNPLPNRGSYPHDMQQQGGQHEQQQGGHSGGGGLASVNGFREEDVAAARWSKLLHSRSGGTPRLKLHEFQVHLHLALADACEGFARLLEPHSGPAAGVVRSSLQQQCRAFLEALHSRNVAQLQQLLEVEQWTATEVAPTFQAIVARLVAAVTPGMGPTPHSSTRAGGHTSSLADTPSSSRRSTSELLAQGRDSSQGPGAAAAAQSSGGVGGVGGAAPGPGGGVLLHGKRFTVVNTTLMLLKLLDEYLTLAATSPLYGVEIGHHVCDLIKVFNTQACQLVLGAGAVRTAGLKSISAKHLALSCESCYLVACLVPSLRAAFMYMGGSRAPAGSAGMEPRRHMLLLEFDKITQDLTLHTNEIHSKLVDIMQDRLVAAARQLSQEAAAWGAPLRPPAGSAPPHTPEAAAGPLGHGALGWGKAGAAVGAGAVNGHVGPGHGQKSGGEQQQQVVEASAAMRSLAKQLGTLQAVLVPILQQEELQLRCSTLPPPPPQQQQCLESNPHLPVQTLDSSGAGQQGGLAAADSGAALQATPQEHTEPAPPSPLTTAALPGEGPETPQGTDSLLTRPVSHLHAGTSCHPLPPPLQQQGVEASAQVVYLSKNSLTSAAGITQFACVVTLSLADNLLADLDQVLAEVSCLPCLQALSLEGNPCASLPFYRPRTLASLPQLTVLDKCDVSEAERCQALALVAQEDAHLATMTHNACLVHKLARVYQQQLLHRDLFATLYGTRMKFVRGLAPDSVPVNPQRLLELWDYEASLSAQERSTIQAALRREVGRRRDMAQQAGRGVPSGSHAASAASWDSAYAEVMLAQQQSTAQLLDLLTVAQAQLAAEVRDRVTGQEIHDMHTQEDARRRVLQDERQHLVAGLQSAFQELSPGGRVGPRRPATRTAATARCEVACDRALQAKASRVMYKITQAHRTAGTPWQPRHASPGSQARKAHGTSQQAVPRTQQREQAASEAARKLQLRRAVGRQVEQEWEAAANAVREQMMTQRWDHGVELGVWEPGLQGEWARSTSAGKRQQLGGGRAGAARGQQQGSSREARQALRGLSPSRDADLGQAHTVSSFPAARSTSPAASGQGRGQGLGLGLSSGPSSEAWAAVRSFAAEPSAAPAPAAPGASGGGEEGGGPSRQAGAAGQGSTASMPGWAGGGSLAPQTPSAPPVRNPEISLSGAVLQLPPSSQTQSHSAPSVSHPSHLLGVTQGLGSHLGGAAAAWHGLAPQVGAPTPQQASGSVTQQLNCSHHPLVVAQLPEPQTRVWELPSPTTATTSVTFTTHPSPRGSPRPQHSSAARDLPLQLEQQQGRAGGQQQGWRQQPPPPPQQQRQHVAHFHSSSEDLGAAGLVRQGEQQVPAAASTPPTAEAAAAQGQQRVVVEEQHVHVHVYGPGSQVTTTRQHPALRLPATASKAAWPAPRTASSPLPSLIIVPCTRPLGPPRPSPGPKWPPPPSWPWTPAAPADPTRAAMPQRQMMTQAQLLRIGLNHRTLV